MTGRVVAVVLAGGSGTRMRGATTATGDAAPSSAGPAPSNKVHLAIGGRPILAFSLAAFESCDVVSDIVLVVRAGDDEATTAVIAAVSPRKLRAVVTGGATRQASEMAGLEAVRAIIAGTAAATGSSPAVGSAADSAAGEPDRHGRDLGRKVGSPPGDDEVAPPPSSGPDRVPASEPASDPDRVPASEPASDPDRVPASDPADDPGSDPERAPDDEHIVLIHDGARPFVGHDLVERLVSAARAHGGALPGLAFDTAVIAPAELGGMRRVETAPLWRVQTPQAFRSTPLLAAYATAATVPRFDGVDTADTVQRFATGAGDRPVAVVVVAGDPDNLKVTTPDDLPRAEAIAHRRLRAAAELTTRES